MRASEAGADAATANRLPPAPPPFPLKGRDVTARGVPAGPAVGRFLAEVEQWWEDGDFRADRAQCLAELARRIGVRDGRIADSDG